jgi:DNA (cytosine-5)-methyltransferase 1
VTAPTVLSAFSGLGGMDLGLEVAGFASLGCVEIDPVARRSLKANRSDAWPILGDDIDEVAGAPDSPVRRLGRGELSLLAGGPPCQPYSKAAMWAPTAWAGLADERATPLHSFLRLVDLLCPEAVLIENVPGFARGPRSALSTVAAALAQINARHGTAYAATVSILDAAEYGVPQHRQRAIVIARRDGGSGVAPLPTHVTSPVRAWDAIGSLPPDDEVVSPAGRWAKLLPSIPEGENYLWHTTRGGGLPLFGYRTRYWSFLLKLAKCRPAWTLAAQPGPSTGPFHWDNRPLTTVEMLRLQSFPADWKVEGDRRERVRQVGNATPPLLAEVLGRHLRSILHGEEVRTATLAIPLQDPVPPARRRLPVPKEYLGLVGDHPDHPGTGSGPRPRPSIGAEFSATSGEVRADDRR